MEIITPESAGSYLQQHGIIPVGVTVSTELLGGGVSNRVIKVRWDDDCLVVKQPRANLAVDDDWPADRERVHNEAAAARAYESIIGERGVPAAHVPNVVFEDRTDHVIALDCAPRSAKMWKSSLLEGEVNVDIARSVGRILGAVHDASCEDPDRRETFTSGRPFEQLRLNPYHRTVADRHPDVASQIEAEIARICSVEATLVHGDYSPKNVLVEPYRSEPAVWIIDFEVAHWGDPSFDVAFMLNHLFIKSLYNHEQYDAYIDAARTFWKTYTNQVDWDVEHATVSELSVLMLARVDGKSPVEYINEGPFASEMRALAKRAIRAECSTLDEFIQLTKEVAQKL